MASSSELSHEESGISLSDNDILAREDNADNPSEETLIDTIYHMDMKQDALNSWQWK